VNSALVITVDTAWYHLASFLGAPTVAIPGPTSYRHFAFPGSRGMAIEPRLDFCLDCYSSDSCALTRLPACHAQPSADAILTGIQHVSGASRVEKGKLRVSDLAIKGGLYAVFLARRLLSRFR
jgi:hypothetical protein